MLDATATPNGRSAAARGANLKLVLLHSVRWFLIRRAYSKLLAFVLVTFDFVLNISTPLSLLVFIVLGFLGVHAQAENYTRAENAKTPNH